MAKSQRNLAVVVVPLALLVAWFTLGQGLVTQKAESEPAGKEQDGLQQAAASIVAVAKQRVADAKSDDEAIQRAHMADEVLRLIGTLGQIDTVPQSDELLKTYQTGKHPMVVDAVIQLRLADALRQWEELDDAQHLAIIDHFVSDVKKTGLTRGQAEFLVRVANMLGDGSDSKLVIKAVNEILPLARESSDPELKRMASVFEGTLRRLNLPGKPLEIDGTLLSGAKLNWNSYRGKVVLVDFFASFCEPCRQEVPNVLEHYHAYRNKGFEVIGVNLDKDRRMCQAYMEQTGFNFPTVIGDNPAAVGWDLPVARRYGITRIPRVILVDQNGNVVSTQVRGERLGELLEQLLGPADRPPVRTTSQSEDPSVTTAGGINADKGRVVQASALEDAGAPAPPPEPSTAPEPPKE